MSDDLERQMDAVFQDAMLHGIGVARVHLDDFVATDRIKELERDRDGAYLERNQLVALLASVYPSGIKRTAIEGWHEDWHGCVYVDFPWGQASWHYHVSQADLFAHLPPYQGQWDGHSTEAKYTAIVDASRKDNNAKAKLTKAVEALREVQVFGVITHTARAVLAELEGK
jgi:hypothetical protein